MQALFYKPACVMQLTVDTGAVTALRQMVMRVCGDTMEFMRIEACEHGARMKVWLCVGEAMVGRVMEVVMQSLPGAEFGRFTASRPAAKSAAKFAARMAA